MLSKRQAHCRSSCSAHHVPLGAMLLFFCELRVPCLWLLLSQPEPCQVQLLENAARRSSALVPFATSPAKSDAA